MHYNVFYVTILVSQIINNFLFKKSKIRLDFHGSIREINLKISSGRF